MAEETVREERIKRLLKTVVDHFDKEDRSARDRQLRRNKQLKYLWDGIERVWFSEVAHDWRVAEPEQYANDNAQSYYDKPVNVLKAYLESIIAALSVTTPPIFCYPDDADNSLDLATANAGNRIAKLIYRHNNVQLLWLHALFVFCTEGLICCYNYTDEDKKYGTYVKKTYEDQVETHKTVTCPNCGAQIADDIIDPEQDKFDPNDQDAMMEELCPSCRQMVQMQAETKPLTVNRLVGQTVEAKARQCLEVYGSLNVKVPLWAKEQSQIPYLFFCYEDDYANIAEEYDELREALISGDKGKSGGSYNQFEEWARLSTQYRGEFPINNRTVRKCWLRPAAFNIVTDQKDVDFLKKEFPDGCKVVFVNDLFAEACNEALDDHWTLSKNPLSDYLHHDPLAVALTSIQDITNTLISLVLQTVEHGVSQTFVDEGVIDLSAYADSEVLPGGIYSGRAKSGKTMNDAFFQTRTATLSQEVMPFAEKIQSLGQLVSGALPSLFGGAMNESNTASEYSMSRAQALQRLQNTWKMLTCWWKEIFGKVIPAYIENVHEDEKDVTRDKFGGFANTLIRMAELEGKIGKVELEANENLPMTWGQIKDVVMQLLQSQSPEILQVLGAPENLPIIRQAIGLDDFFVPGEDDRVKQYEEIKILINSQPMSVPPQINPQMGQMAPGLVAQNPQLQQMMQPSMQPSVQVDPEVDNHNVQLEICKAWAVSDAGRICKLENEAGYQNVLLHAQQHQQYIQQAMMAQMQQAQGAQGAPPPSPKQNTQAPIQQEGDVSYAH